jgi:large subunit ribosomal protein L4
MTVKLFSATGAKQTGTVKVPDAKLSDAGVSRVVRATLANDNRERPLAKTRGLVSGGGAKPWRQKGTGRARAGSNRSPIWRGGGVTFGPSGEPRPYKRIPRPMRQAALLVVLSQLAESDRLSVVSGKVALAKSKAAADVLAKISPEGSVLFVITKDERPHARGVRNLAAVQLTTVDNCNAYDLVRSDQVVLTEAAFKALTEAAKTGGGTARRSGAKSGESVRQRGRSPVAVASDRQTASASKKATKPATKPAAKPRSVK